MRNNEIDLGLYEWTYPGDGLAMAVGDRWVPFAVGDRLRIAPHARHGKLAVTLERAGQDPVAAVIDAYAWRLAVRGEFVRQVEQE